MPDNPRPSYEQFVTSRVKWFDSLGANLVHASIGIMGELIELEAANTRDNLIEELGDLEFYLEHYRQSWARAGFTTHDSARLAGYGSSLTLAAVNSRTFAGALLDLSKKVWVYNKPPKDIAEEAWSHFHSLRVELGDTYRQLGISRDVVRSANEAKLLLRYPSGYLDTHAQARMDKAPGL